MKTIKVFYGEFKKNYSNCKHWGYDKTTKTIFVEVTDEVETPKEEKKYFVKESYRFNLESMGDKLHCLMYDVEEGKLQFPFRVANTDIKNYGDIYDLLDECYELRFKADRKVTGTEYGRIKEIVNWRVEQRYFTCINNGMSETEAGVCFSDL